MWGRGGAAQGADPPKGCAIVPEVSIERTRMEFTAVFEKVPEGYIGFVEELPGANTQAATLDEARENLKEAIHLVLEANRVLAEESIRGHAVIKERLAAA